ncbi:MAG: acyl-CoA dehydrogenase family protein [Lautropia sp.]
MNFSLSDDHRMLQDAAQRFLSTEVDTSLLLVPGADVGALDQKRLWKLIAGLGWPALVIPESYGGLAMTTIDVATVLREWGRHLATAPLLGTLAGTWALLAAGSEPQKQRWLPAVADGSLPLALAVAGPDGSLGGGNHAAHLVTEREGSPTLSGRACYVVDAAEAGGLIVAADHEGTQRFCFVAAGAAGLEIERLEWRDITREVCHLRFDRVPAEILPIAYAEAWPWIRDRLWLALAADSAGGLQAVLDETVAYAKERVAFGRPIGSYQAIKHALADMLAQTECAATAVLYAGWALSASSGSDATLAAAMAQSHASEAYREATHRSIQIFGAIGFTWEMKRHLYFNRARANAELLGSPAQQRAVIARLLSQRYAEQPRPL